LWIALDLYLWNIEHSFLANYTSMCCVVNCSRFVSLKYWTQLRQMKRELTPSCELLSICIFEILNTANPTLLKGVKRLWIALDLYLWNIEHSESIRALSHNNVVNCSRFVSLKYWTQHNTSLLSFSMCCELLSICIFEILNTAKEHEKTRALMLWIALDLYLWNIEHSSSERISNHSSVVNCSRFVSLKYWTQRFIGNYRHQLCCELLSICIFEILNTAPRWRAGEIYELWIALDLYLWNIEHSINQHLLLNA